MQLVYIPGVWDLLHVGHLTILERARALGDRLAVGVPSDEVVIEDKGTAPVIPLADRMRMLSALHYVDLVLAYHRLEFMTHLKMLQPDILVVGETWGCAQRHQDAERWIRQHGKRLIQLPYYRGESSTNIKGRIEQGCT